MAQHPDLSSAKPWALTSVVGAVTMAALAYLQSVFQGQAGIFAVVAGIGCVVVAVVLNALLASVRGRLARVEDFEVVLKSRFPSAHDRLTRPWGKLAGQLLAMRRWKSGRYGDPELLRRVRDLARRIPDDRQAYGHLRPAGAA